MTMFWPQSQPTFRLMGACAGHAFALGYSFQE